MDDDVWEGTVLAVNKRTGEILRVAFLSVEGEDRRTITVKSTDDPARIETITEEGIDRCPFMPCIFNSMRRVCRDCLP